MYCIMKVPSTVIKGDYSFLIKPSHPDFKKVKIMDATPFPFDNRLFKK